MVAPPTRPDARALVVALCLLAALGASCAPTEQPAQPAVPTEDPAPTQERVVSLVPSVTELIFAIGADDLLVARSVHCDYPQAAAELPSVGSGLDPNVERILGLRPTLVVATEAQRDLPALTGLADRGVAVFVVPDLALADVYVALERLGDRLLRRDQADAVAAEVRERLAAAAADASGRPTTRTLIAVGREPLYVAGPQTRVGELLALVGGENVVSGSWVQLDAEALIAAQPDVIIDAIVGSVAADVWARFPSIPAVANGRVCRVDGNALARPGPRLADAAEQIAACLRPTEPR